MSSHAVWLRVVADHGDVNMKQKERLYAAADRIDDLEAANEDLDMVAGLRQARIDELEAQREAFVSIAAETRAADVARITELEEFINELGVEIMHPDMGGAHQCHVRASGTKLLVPQWDVVLSCRALGDTDES